MAPALTGWILERTGQFYWALVIMVGIVLIGVASWIFVVGRVEPVIWRRKNAGYFICVEPLHVRVPAL